LKKWKECRPTLRGKTLEVLMPAYWIVPHTKAQHTLVRQSHMSIAVKKQICLFRWESIKYFMCKRLKGKHFAIAEGCSLADHRWWASHKNRHESKKLHMQYLFFKRAGELRIIILRGENKSNIKELVVKEKNEDRLGGYHWQLYSHVSAIYMWWENNEG